MIYEPTGAYHGEFERVLHAAGLPLVKVNPYQARRFAQAAGLLAKTDALDARCLAMMGQALTLRRTQAYSARQAELKELGVAREALMKDRVAALNRRARLRHGLPKRQNEARLRQVDRQLRALDTHIGHLVESDPPLSRRCTILTSIPGVGPITARGLLSRDARTGLARCQIGGESGGAGSDDAPVRAMARAGLCARRATASAPLDVHAALAAMRCNPDLGRKYRQLRAAGKPPKVAITAIMRKLIVLANVLLVEDRVWTDRPVPNAG